MRTIFKKISWVTSHLASGIRLDILSFTVCSPQTAVSMPWFFLQDPIDCIFLFIVVFFFQITCLYNFPNNLAVRWLSCLIWSRQTQKSYERYKKNHWWARKFDIDFLWFEVWTFYIAVTNFTDISRSHPCIQVQLQMIIIINLCFSSSPIITQLLL